MLVRGLPPELSTTLTISSRVAGGVVSDVVGGVGTAGSSTTSGGNDSRTGAGKSASRLGGVIVRIKGGNEDLGPETYSTEGFRSQTTVSEIRVWVGLVTATYVVLRLGTALLANSTSYSGAVRS
jgi:hypothetical protein